MTSNSKNANLRKSMAWTAILIVLGLLALIGGVKTLVLLLPAAAFVWYQARPVVHGGRN
ncbi:MAG: hypothetical protein WB729_11405 [Candidatus Sulfotelmatobacter sp.]